MQYGDIAVLAVSTWSLPLLFEHLDAEGVLYASRGGKAVQVLTVRQAKGGNHSPPKG